MVLTSSATVNDMRAHTDDEMLDMVRPTRAS